MTQRLILLRHAKSAWPADTLDAARPLATRGQRDATAAGRWLREQGPTIDLVVCSTAVRAVQTWHLVAAQLNPIPRVRYEECLYMASAEDLLTATVTLPTTASTAALVGHNPGLEDFVTLLTGAHEPFKTSGIAVITTPGNWERYRPGSCTLEALVTPRGEN